MRKSNLFLAIVLISSVLMYLSFNKNQSETENFENKTLSTEFTTTNDNSENFVDLAEAVPNIIFHIRYDSTYNFTNKRIES